MIEKAGLPHPQSRIVELSDESFLSELATTHNSVIPSPYEIYDPSIPSPKLPMPASLQRRSSPELRHPVNSESDRSSLWERRRGTLAANHRHDTANRCGIDCPFVETENAIWSKYWEASESIDLQVEPARDNDIPANTASENEISPEDLSDSHQFWANSPKYGYTSSPPNVLTLISPIDRGVHPPSNIVFPSTGTCDALGSRMLEYHQDDAGGWISPSSSPLQSTLEKHNNIRSAFISSEPNLAGSQSGSYPNYPHHLTPHLSDSDGVIQSSNFDKSSESEASPSMTQPLVTQVDTSRSENASFLPIVSSAFTPKATRTESSSQTDNNIFSLHQPTSTFSSLDCIITEDGRNEMARDFNMREKLSEDREGDGKIPEQENNFQEDYIQEAERSDRGQFCSLLEAQLRSPLDTLIATITSEIHPASPPTYLSHGPGHPAPQYHLRESINSHPLSVKLLPHCFNHNSLVVSRSAPKSRQVEELQRLFRIINSEWMQRMNPLSELRLHCNTIPTSGLFKRAVRVLKDFICGRQVLDFEGIFAMMHLAFSGAFLLHWQPDFDYFNAFIDDTLQWEYALPSDEDKVRFLDAMSCWRLHKLEPTSLLNRNFHTCFASMRSQRSRHSSDPRTLSNMLRNSKVYKSCIALLEGKSTRSLFKTHSDNSN